MDNEAGHLLRGRGGGEEGSEEIKTFEMIVSEGS